MLQMGGKKGSKNVTKGNMSQDWVVKVKVGGERRGGT